MVVGSRRVHALRLLAEPIALVAERTIQVLEEVRRVDAQRRDVGGRELGLLRGHVLDEGLQGGAGGAAAVAGPIVEVVLRRLQFMMTTNRLLND